MRKFNFLSFLIGVIAVGGVGAFALSSQYLKSDGTPNFQELKSTANKNRLNAEMRDQLMDGLSKMQEKIPTTNGETIPAGAVMAFNLSSCPDGWSPFTEANGRFIMGSQGSLGEKGGNRNISLTVNQLPSHYFYIFAGKGSPANLWDFKEASASNQGNVGDNYTMESSIHTPNAGRTNTVWKGDSIDITNPYIKLLYCVKGKYEPTKQTTIKEKESAVDGVCWKTMYTCRAGTSTDEQAQRNHWKNGGTSSRFRTRTCQGENWGKNSPQCTEVQNWPAKDGIRSDTPERDTSL